MLSLPVSPTVAADESLRDRYIVAASWYDGRHERGVRALLRRHRLPGQRRIHARNESAARRRRILEDVVKSGLVRWWIYVAPFPANEARRVIIRSLVEDCVDHDARRLVIEYGDEARNRRDRVEIARALMDAKGYLHYSHDWAWSHPGLELADLGAWTYGAGGEWRDSIMPMVDHVRELAH